MDQNSDNQSMRTNRFIFSNDFYNQLSSDDSIIEDNNSNQGETEPLKFDSINLNQEENNINNNISNEKVEVENNKIQPELTSTNELIDIPNLQTGISDLNKININQSESEFIKPSSTIFEPIDNNIEKELTEINIPNISNENTTITNTNSITENNPVLNNDLTNINLNNTNKENITPNSFENNISIPIQEFSEEDKMVEIPIISDPKIVETTNTQNNSKLEVETGINTDLEKEIMSYQSEQSIKPSIVQNTNSIWGQESTKRVAYRATRNPVQRVAGIENLYQPTTPNVKIEEKTQTPKIEPQIIITAPEQEEKWQPNATIPVIIKEGELEKIKTDKLENTIKNAPVMKSDLIEKLKIKEQETGKISILARYGDDFCSRDYITNPAIGRQEEIKQLILILLTPEKSGLLVGKPGIGKTSIVEGLAYCLQRNNVPEALRGFRIVSIKAISLLGTLPTGETRLQTLIDELKELDKIILFIDETHMLMGATENSSVDFANMFKESLGRGSIKMIGATTSDEYERYVLRDKAFVRRFQRVDVEEPTKEQTVRILLGTLPKIEKNSGAKLKYSSFIQSEIMKFIVDITTEYKRVYGIGSRYPDICLTLLSQAFSHAVFDNRKEVDIFDIRNAIENSKNIYPDVIRKELINFDEKFKQIINEEKAI